MHSNQRVSVRGRQGGRHQQTRQGDDQTRQGDRKVPNPDRRPDVYAMSAAGGDNLSTSVASHVQTSTYKCDNPYCWEYREMTVKVYPPSLDQYKEGVHPENRYERSGQEMYGVSFSNTWTPCKYYCSPWCYYSHRRRAETIRELVGNALPWPKQSRDEMGRPEDHPTNTHKKRNIELSLEWSERNDDQLWLSVWNFLEKNYNQECRFTLAHGPNGGYGANAYTWLDATVAQVDAYWRSRVKRAQATSDAETTSADVSSGDVTSADATSGAGQAQSTLDSALW